MTSYNEAAYVFFQGLLTDGPNAGEHAMFVVEMGTPGMRVVRTPEYTHTIGHQPTRSSRSTTCGCRPRTSSAAKATA